MLSSGELSHTLRDYVPPTRPYELADLALDLTKFAHWMLKPGGRLVFFLPTVNDDYQEVDIPVVEGMELVANSLQDFGSWGRRLITMRKCDSVPTPLQRPCFPLESAPSEETSEHVPAHKDFRAKYFAGFKRGE